MSDKYREGRRRSLEAGYESVRLIKKHMSRARRRCGAIDSIGSVRRHVRPFRATGSRSLCSSAVPTASAPS